jgi:hypothetical protein
VFQHLDFTFKRAAASCTKLNNKVQGCLQAAEGAVQVGGCVACVSILCHMILKSSRGSGGPAGRGCSAGECVFQHRGLMFQKWYGFMHAVEL